MVGILSFAFVYVVSTIKITKRFCLEFYSPTTNFGSEKFSRVLNSKLYDGLMKSGANENFVLKCP